MPSILEHLKHIRNLQASGQIGEAHKALEKLIEEMEAGKHD